MRQTIGYCISIGEALEKVMAAKALLKEAMVKVMETAPEETATRSALADAWVAVLIAESHLGKIHYAK